MKRFTYSITIKSKVNIKFTRSFKIQANTYDDAMGQIKNKVYKSEQFEFYINSIKENIDTESPEYLDWFYKTYQAF